MARERETKGSHKSRFGGVAISLSLKISVVLIIGLGIFAYYAYQSAQKLPDFYKEALAISDRTRAESGVMFENSVIDLQNAVQREGGWQAVFTEDQINGWMTVDFAKKFPNWLPQEISLPRVSIEPGNLKFACQFKSNRLSGIVVASANAFCTEQENEIGIRVRSVNSGIIPIPVHRLADQITAGLRGAGIPATWIEIEGDPVALISITRKLADVDDDNIVMLTSVSIEEKQIVLTGKTIAR